MELIELENIASKEKLNIVNYKMKPKARIIDKYIFMNYQKIHDEKEEKLILAEELGHYYYDAYYCFNSDTLFISKQEYKARKFMYNTLIPFENLCKAILNR